MKKILLIAFSLSFLSCAKPIHPHVLDTQLNELREYEIVDPINLTLKFKVSHPLGVNGYGNGFWCVPPEDAATIKEEALKCMKKQK